MTRWFVRSGPTNSRALWHMVHPGSRDGLTWCSRRPTGPTTCDPAEVLASPWSWCERCAERRWEAINGALRLLRAEAPDLLIKAERLEEGT